jgi:hypothetical protein
MMDFGTRQPTSNDPNDELMDDFARRLNGLPTKGKPAQANPENPMNDVRAAAELCECGHSRLCHRRGAYPAGSTPPKATCSQCRCDEFATPLDTPAGAVGLDLDRLAAAVAKAPPGPWKSSGQDGKPGHCYVAQVWDCDGNSLAEVTPNDEPAVATNTAAYIAAFDPPTVQKLLALAARDAGREGG